MGRSFGNITLGRSAGGIPPIGRPGPGAHDITLTIGLRAAGATRRPAKTACVPPRVGGPARPESAGRSLTRLRVAGPPPGSPSGRGSRRPPRARRAARPRSSTDSRMRSSVFRSRIWVARASPSPSFSTRARTRRALSSVRAAIASISSSRSSSSTLISSASAIFGEDEELLEARGGSISWALARISASRARISVSREALLPQLHDQAAEGRSSPAGRPGRRAGRTGSAAISCVEDLAADRLPLLDLEPPLEDLAERRRAARPRLSKPIESRNAASTSGSRSCFRSWTWNVTRIVWPRRRGSAERRADLGLGLAGLARLDPDEGRAEVRDACRPGTAARAGAGTGSP